MIRKAPITISSLLTLITSASAHGNDYGSGMMSGWMHNGSHVIGYNMWGMNGLGIVVNLGFWILAFLGAFFIYDKLTERGEEQ